ncbi:MAG: 1-acyl-sn-glycerol-3-phosphate acyltransferase [Gammaproteobacteria bacterium]|nr:1-acyl-sn-glycerol-3-phosphate acyltransferase [Gammaproteobacteria bacterium]
MKLSPPPLRPLGVVPAPGAGGTAGHRLLRGAHGVVSWLVFLVVALLALPLLALLPPLRWRRALARGVARTALGAAGMRLAVRGREALPHPSVVVANHASYLDGIVLTACLPPDFGFVIKREMNSVPLAAWLLRLIGAEFVDRNGRSGKARDALRVVRSATRGQALVFFPEGTFAQRPGLLPFHRGAFAAAARAGLPVVPTVIRGTRACLAPGTLLPRAGTIEICFLAAISADGTARDAAAQLGRAARERILRELGEPDLAPPSGAPHGIMADAGPEGAARR